MVWCEFWVAEKNPHYYYIEAPFIDAVKILKERFGIDMYEGNYYVHHEEKPTFTLATGHNRRLRYLHTPRDENGLYDNSNPILTANFYLEDDQEPPVGFYVEPESIGNSQSVEEFKKRSDVTIVRKETLK